MTDKTKLALKRAAVPLSFAASGLLTALPLVYPVLAPLGWAAFAPAAYLLSSLDFTSRGGLRRAYLYGLCFFEAFGLVLFSWFRTLYPLSFIDGMTKTGAAAVVAAGWIGLSLLQSVASAVQFVLAALVFRITAKAGASQTGTSPAGTVSGFCRVICPPLLYASLFTVFEWLQAQTWAGVPWGRLAVGQTAYLPFIQSASLFGSYFTGFLMILTGSLAAAAALALREKDHRRAHQRAFTAVIAAVTVFAVNYTYGAVRVAVYEANDTGETVKTAVLQGNVSSADKWDSAKLSRILETYKTLSLSAAEEGASLIVWPETAVPYTLNAYRDLMDSVSAAVAESGAEALVGAFARSDAIEEGENAFRTFTSTLYFTADGEYTGQFYSKRRLVPFGEYLPMEKLVSLLIPPLAGLTMYEQPLSPGTDASVFDTASGRVGSLICFDTIYERLTVDSVRAGAQLLAISTNDSWFSDSSALYQHNSHAVLRAVEAGRYIVRAANTGISSVITPTGRVTDTLEPLTEGYIAADVRPRSDITLYVRLGNAFVTVCALTAAVYFAFPAVIALSRRGDRSRGSKKERPSPRQGK